MNVKIATAYTVGQLVDLLSNFDPETEINPQIVNYYFNGINPAVISLTPQNQKETIATIEQFNFGDPLPDVLKLQAG